MTDSVDELAIVALPAGGATLAVPGHQIFIRAGGHTEDRREQPLSG
jgi:hypothetical protein